MEAFFKVARILGSVVVLLIEAPIALLLIVTGALVLVEWSAITRSYAAVSGLFVIAAAVAFAGALWGVIALGQKRVPFLLAGGATALAGIVTILAVKGNLIPCGGPS